MIKKSAIVLFLVLILLTVNTCSVKTNNRKDNNSIVVSTKQVTLIRNSFADVLPNFKFENEINRAAMAAQFVHKIAAADFFAVINFIIGRGDFAAV